MSGYTLFINARIRSGVARSINGIHADGDGEKLRRIPRPMGSLMAAFVVGTEIADQADAKRLQVFVVSLREACQLARAIEKTPADVLPAGGPIAAHVPEIVLPFERQAADRDYPNSARGCLQVEVRAPRPAVHVDIVGR